MEVILRRIVRMLAAAGLLLLGIQIPNLVNQYEQHVDADLLELKTFFAPYQQMADKSTGGSLDELIAQRDRSNNQDIHAQAKVLRETRERQIAIEEEKASLQVNVFYRIAKFVGRSDRERMEATFRDYTYTMTLDRDAVMIGLLFMLAVMLAIDSLAGIWKYLRLAYGPSRGR